MAKPKSQMLSPKDKVVLRLGKFLYVENSHGRLYLKDNREPIDPTTGYRFGWIAEAISAEKVPDIRKWAISKIKHKIEKCKRHIEKAENEKLSMEEALSDFEMLLENMEQK